MTRRWWWLSFCDPARPAGAQFLGVALVQASGSEEACATAWARGCNPGGEVACVDAHPMLVVPDELAYRLLDRAEADRASRDLAEQVETLLAAGVDVQVLS